MEAPNAKIGALTTMNISEMIILDNGEAVSDSSHEPCILQGPAIDQR